VLQSWGLSLNSREFDCGDTNRIRKQGERVFMKKIYDHRALKVISLKSHKPLHE
jgi:hypothetical protein